MKTIAIIQARMGSERLPGKVLMDIYGKPMLQWVVERVQQAMTIDRVGVATTTEPEDDVIMEWAFRQFIPVYRGRPTDVLDRYYQAAHVWHADPIVRITADCPMIDPGVIDRVVRRCWDSMWDYVSNVDPPTYPDGLDVEVLRKEALTLAWLGATLPSDREHVTPWIRARKAELPQCNVINDVDLSHLRWTVDTAVDLEFVQAVYRLTKGRFIMAKILQLLEKHPELAQINAGQERNEAYLRQVVREQK